MLRMIAACVALICHAAAQTTLVKATRVLDVSAGQYLQNQGILIEGGFFKQIAPFETARAAEPNALLIDLGDLTVLPGLIDCHTHLLVAMAEKMNGADALILSIAKMTPAKRALLGAQMAKEDLKSGFTIVRNVGHSGVDGDVALRDAINNRWVPGPRILASARKIAPHGGQAIPVQDGVLDSILKVDFLTASNPEEGRRAVLDDLRAGADLIKVVADEGRRILNLDTMRAIVEEAHKVDVKVAAHATSSLGIQVSIDAGVDSIEHADSATGQQFQAMRTKRIFLVPTLWPKELTVHWPGLAAVDAPPRLKNIDGEEYLKQYMADQRAKMDRARKAGIRIAFGSDEWFERDGISRGQATLKLLAAMEQFGISPADALRAATIDAADLLGVKDYAGSIEPKKFADIVAVDGDPLRHLGDIEKVRFVMKGGRIVRDETHRRI
jgi:imidazolonepropionase-like amidohydrolase